MGSIEAGICCDDAGTCRETEGIHRQVPDESPEQLHYSVQITALLKHPLTGTISYEKNNLPTNSFAHFYSQYSTFAPLCCLFFSVGNNTVFSEVTGRDGAIPAQSSCSEAHVYFPIKADAVALAWPWGLHLDSFCSQCGFVLRPVLGLPA